jgi:type 2A phosphatase activator TIP41
MMPNSFYLLLRYFMRVDGVHVRLNETRIYHEFSWNYLLREYTSREASMATLNVINSQHQFVKPLNLFIPQIPSALCVDPNRIMHMLPLVNSSYDKVILPNDPSSENGTSPSTAAVGQEE